MIAVSFLFSTDCKSLWIYSAPKKQAKAAFRWENYVYSIINYMWSSSSKETDLQKRRADLRKDDEIKATKCVIGAHHLEALDLPVTIFRKKPAYKAVLKPTPVNWYTLLRRVREPCWRNSANWLRFFGIRRCAFSKSLFLKDVQTQNKGWRLFN